MPLSRTITMKKFHLTRTLFLVILIAAFGVVTIIAVPQESTSDTDKLEDRIHERNYPQKEVVIDSPARISIPSIRVSAEVEHVSIDEKGNMATPKTLEGVAWYAPGARPGGSGSAVFAGHVNNARGTDGVFARLDELKPRDQIIIEGDGGERVVYEVTAHEVYNYRTAPVLDIFSDVGESRLALITCSGEWLASEGTYENRLVVFARRAGA